eukprot:CAMPEP_0168395330 /NCGR_PEP_ID=MMETSP0228-20121227/19989_1 /TAXON_ID=133427 /ORGANISM="Protoceratium reticulatum, Strain CCCM 535 (=CCMP 1889)" /LENGTH=197 /DNA_ID=CAMNT_0008408761 /DNA_START=262 /DNA_END=855 /DNA_ORIENTATION=-
MPRGSSASRPSSWWASPRWSTWSGARRSRPAVVLALVGSCLILVVLSERVMDRGRELASRFASGDCSGFPGKWELERGWQAAKKFHKECSESSKVMNPVMENCPGYEAQLGRHPEWRYLAGLEDRHLCGGWCSAHVQLWALGETPSAACSQRVGEALHMKAARVGTQLFIYGLLLLLITVAVLLQVGPVIRSLGVDW